MFTRLNLSILPLLFILSLVSSNNGNAEHSISKRQVQFNVGDFLTSIQQPLKDRQREKPNPGLSPWLGLVGGLSQIVSNSGLQVELNDGGIQINEHLTDQLMNNQNNQQPSQSTFPSSSNSGFNPSSNNNNFNLPSHVPVIIEDNFGDSSSGTFPGAPAPSGSFQNAPSPSGTSSNSNFDVSGYIDLSTVDFDRDCRQRKYTYTGTELDVFFRRKERPKNPKACQTLCQRDARCQYFVYVQKKDPNSNDRRRRCILYSTIWEVKPSEHRISGPRNCEQLFGGDSPFTGGDSDSSGEVTIDNNHKNNNGDCYTSSGSNPGVACIFPFTHLGVKYNGCTLADSNDGYFWCSTLVNGEGVHVGGRGQWGHCPSHCPFDEDGSNPFATSRPVTSRPVTVRPPTTFRPPTTQKPTIPSYDCGVNAKPFQNRIVGGKKADPSEYPWLAALLRDVKNETQQYCGATLITNQHLVTAAHCISPFKLHEMTVRLGEYDFSKDEGTELDIKLLSFVIHEDYNRRTYENDIAILTLIEPIRLTNKIYPICLPRPFVSYANERAYVLGWGKIYFSGPVSDEVLEANLRVWHNRDCVNAYQTFNRKVTENMLCASDRGKDSCQGDSGGPLNCLNVNTGRWELCGVVSWGLRCNEEKYPGVYTRVNKYLDWIAARLV